MASYSSYPINSELKSTAGWRTCIGSTRYIPIYTTKSNESARKFLISYNNYIQITNPKRKMSQMPAIKPETTIFFQQAANTLIMPNNLKPAQEDSPQVKNRKWSQQQHMLYILFLDLNKEKIKSKFIRRSNAFFKEMSNFIATKTAIQCRSHHQKYQEKYKYPHRVIKGEKDKLPPGAYDQVIQTAKRKEGFSVLQEQAKREKELDLIFREGLRKSKVSTGCQTDIKGIHQVLFLQQDQCMKQSETPPPFRQIQSTAFHPFLPFYGMNNMIYGWFQ